MFINEAFAAQAVGVGSLGSTLVQIALILLIFYFLLIRPQQKRLKEHADMVNSLKVGDKVITSSGIFGTVKQIKDNEISLEIAPNVVIRIEAMAVSSKTLSQPAVKAGVAKDVEKKTSAKAKSATNKKQTKK